MAWNEETNGQTNSPADGRANGATEALFQSAVPNPELNLGQAPGRIPEANADALAAQGPSGMENGMPNEAYRPGAGPINPLIQQGQPQISQPAVAIGAGMPGAALPMQSAQSPAQTDDETGADDVVWVNRAKRIIAGTHGDPHRQVQLLQQLSVVYLKERYGRSVHADEV